MVMKYHVLVYCQESYIFPKGYIFPKRAALRENIITRENITLLAPPTRDISSLPVNICYIRWSKWMISSKFDGALWLSQSLVTRLGVCYKTIWMQTWQLCALSIMRTLIMRGIFFLGQFPNMELLLLLLSLYFLLNSLYFPGGQYNSFFLTGCLCALNYMSKPDHLPFIWIVHYTSLNIEAFQGLLWWHCSGQRNICFDFHQQACISVAPCLDENGTKRLWIYWFRET